MNILANFTIKLFESFFADSAPILDPKEKVEQDINDRIALIRMILNPSQNFDRSLISQLKFRIKLIHNESFLSAFDLILDRALHSHDKEFKTWAYEHLEKITELKILKTSFGTALNYNIDLSTPEWESKKIIFFNKVVDYLKSIDNQSKACEYQKPPYSTILSYLQTYKLLIFESFFDYPETVTGNYFLLETGISLQPVKLDVKTPMAVTFTFNGQFWHSQTECAASIQSFYDHQEAKRTMKLFLERLYEQLPDLHPSDGHALTPLNQKFYTF